MLYIKLLRNCAVALSQHAGVISRYVIEQYDINVDQKSHVNDYKYNLPNENMLSAIHRTFHSYNLNT